MKPAPGAIKALIKARCGLSIEDNGEGVLLQALTERAKALAIQTALATTLDWSAMRPSFRNWSTKPSTERIFREPEQIRLLVDRLAPRFWLHGRDRRRYEFSVPVARPARNPTRW